MSGIMFDAYLTRDSYTNTWSCQICQKPFSQKGNARRHVETTHQGHQEITCPCCHNKYKNWTSLKVHMRQKHPGYVINNY